MHRFFLCTSVLYSISCSSNPVSVQYLFLVTIRAKGRKTKKPWKIKAFRGYILFIALIWLRRGDLKKAGNGLFAIRRSDTTNDAIFDPDFCGVWILSVAVCFLQLFFSHDYDFPSPQNRFKGPKVVRLQSLRNSRKQKKKNTPQGCVSFFWLRRGDLNLLTFGLWARRATGLLHSAI